MTSTPIRPLLWLRTHSSREVVVAHLHHVRRAFLADGWRVHEAAQPPAHELLGGPLAVLDDPWAEPLPQTARLLATAAAALAPAWRLPLLFGAEGRQGWNPPYPPYTLREYQRRSRGRGPARGVPLPDAAWTGFAAAPAAEAAELLESPWPPPSERRVLVPAARLYRYQDPADHERAELLPFVPEAAQTVVDVGCGGGRLGERLRRPGRTVVGIEPEPELARRAAERLDRVLVATAEEALPSLPGPLDCVVFADVLEHLRDPAGVLELAAERLAPGGRIVAAIPNTAWAPVLRDLAAGRWEPTLAGVQARDHLVPLTPTSFARLAAECGLELESRVPLPTPLPLGLRLWAWLAARSTGGVPGDLAAPQWVFVLRRREDRAP